MTRGSLCATGVALRKESVDRNACIRYLDNMEKQVALRKESVDRNLKAFVVIGRAIGRSPQGERG